MPICEHCPDEKDYRNLAAHQRAAHPQPTESRAEDQPEDDGAPADSSDKPEAPSAVEAMLGDLVGMVKTLSNTVQAVTDRVDRMETGGANDFKKGSNAADVEAAEQSKADINPRVVQIVEETLGDDFRLELKPHRDRPGFEFTVIVPSRLSDLPTEQRPIVDLDSTHPRKYKLDEHGDVVFETYRPEDRRTRAVSSTDSYDVIREHCERVRAYIIATFQKTNRPVPEFKLRQGAHL